MRRMVGGVAALWGMMLVLVGGQMLGGRSAAPPAWLVYLSERAGTPDLWLRTGDHEARAITTGTMVSSFSVAPDGRFVVFASDHMGSTQIYRVRLDGSQLQVLTTGEAQHYTPVWSPDGVWIAYVERALGSSALYRMQADGSARQRLTPRYDDILSPMWTVKSDFLAFVSVSIEFEAMKVYRLQRLPTAGGELQLLNTSQIQRIVARLSPDGRWLAAVSAGRDRLGLYRIDAQNGQTMLLQELQAPGSIPVWSPDGRSIVFNWLRVNNYGLYRMEIESGAVQQLTDHPADENFPVWSPDGEWVAFQSTRAGNLDLYQVRAVGGVEERLTSHPAADYLPAWVLFEEKGWAGARVWLGGGILLMGVGLGRVFFGKATANANAS